MNKRIDNLKKSLINLRGWKTNKKIVVFESDDWGSIRMESKESYQKLLSKGYPVDKCLYNSYDSLETNADLLRLMEVLNSVKDKNGNPAKFTLNNIVANPSFDKIRDANFKEYFYEPFTETLKRYDDTDKVIENYKEGIRKNVFQIQFHGREHVNVNRWLNKLCDGDKALLDAFDFNMFTVSKGNNTSGRRDNLDAFGCAYENEIVTIDNVLHEGLTLFKNIWGFNSESFIAPCYVWPSTIEKILSEKGVKFIQGSYFQLEPLLGLELKVNRKYHYTGQTNSLGMCFLVRNVHFEPIGSFNEDIINDVLADIKRAFFWGKPAIISSHRINFVSRIDNKYSDFNLKLLNKLLKQIVKIYPDVEFMSSDELGRLIKKD